jgi:hypothetical protein
VDEVNVRQVERTRAKISDVVRGAKSKQGTQSETISAGGLGKLS